MDVNRKMLLNNYSIHKNNQPRSLRCNNDSK